MGRNFALGCSQSHRVQIKLQIWSPQFPLWQNEIMFMRACQFTMDMAREPRLEMFTPPVTPIMFQMKVKG